MRRVDVYHLPPSPTGYALNQGGLVLHTRYADHDPLAWRTTKHGVSNIAKGRQVNLCAICFPPPPPRKKATPAKLPSLRPEGRVPEAAVRPWSSGWGSYSKAPTDGETETGA